MVYGTRVLCEVSYDVLVMAMRSSGGRGWGRGKHLNKERR